MRTKQQFAKMWLGPYLTKVSKFAFFVDKKRVIVHAEVLSSFNGKVEVVVCDPQVNDMLRTVITLSYNYGIQHIKQEIVNVVRRLARQMRGTSVLHHAHKGESKWTT